MSLFFWVIALNILHVFAASGDAAGSCEAVVSVIYDAARQLGVDLQASIHCGYGNWFPRMTPYDQPIVVTSPVTHFILLFVSCLKRT